MKVNPKSLKVDLIDGIFPALMLLKPTQSHRKEDIFRPVQYTPRSSLSNVLAIGLAFLVFYRFAVSPGLSEYQQHGSVVFLVFVTPLWAELLTYVFWYFFLILTVSCSFAERPPHQMMPKQAFCRMMVPEVAALVLLLCADVLLTICIHIDINEDGVMTMMEFRVRIFESLRRVLPRLWLFSNFSLLISATLTGNISPAAGSVPGVGFDLCWSVLVAQIVAMCLQHTLSRPEVVAKFCHENTAVSILFGLSDLFFPHSLAMASAILFHAHEHTHAVPTVQRLWTQISGEHRFAHLWTLLSSVFALMLANGLLGKGLLSNAAEFVMNVAALATVIKNMIFANACQHQESWESTLIIFTGSLGLMCWWSELFGPKVEEQPPFRIVCVCLSTVTHLMLSGFFADVFRQRSCPSATECVFLSFWAAVTLLRGSKLEHVSAVHRAHHKQSLSLWQVMEHVGEFGVCEFGLISTIAWMTHLAANAQKWWGTGNPCGSADNRKHF